MSYPKPEDWDALARASNQYIAIFWTDRDLVIYDKGTDGSKEEKLQLLKDALEGIEEADNPEAIDPSEWKKDKPEPEAE